MEQKLVLKSDKYLMPDWIQNICIDMTKSHDSYLYDKVADREILDLFSFFSTLPLGYNHPIFSSKEFIKELICFGGIKPSTGRIRFDFIDELVLEFNRFANIGMNDLFNKYFFIHGGGLAVENAIKIAFDWKRHQNEKNNCQILPEKLEIISLENGFHGVTGWGVTLSDNKLKCDYYPKLPWPKFQAPYIQFPETKENTAILEKKEAQALSEMEQYIQKKGADSIAGIIIELVQGGGGDSYLGKNYVKGLRDLACKYDILLIIDEVQTGFGVTGKVWCSQQYNVRPDLLAFGKKAQISGVCVAGEIPDIMQVLDVPGRLSPTWNGNIIDMIRCKYIIKAYEKYNLIDNAANLGDYLVQSLSKINKLINVRGMGFLIAWDFENTKIRDEFNNQCFDEGLFLLPMKDRTLRMRPNMALSIKEADHALEIIEKVSGNI